MTIDGCTDPPPFAPYPRPSPSFSLSFSLWKEPVAPVPFRCNVCLRENRVDTGAASPPRTPRDEIIANTTTINNDDNSGEFLSLSLSHADSTRSIFRVPLPPYRDGP